VPSLLDRFLVIFDDRVEMAGSSSCEDASGDDSNDSEAGDNDRCFGFEKERGGADDLIEKARCHHGSLCEIQLVLLEFLLVEKAHVDYMNLRIRHLVELR
jgi:hypothetical protein